MYATRRRLCAALVALGCAVGVAACGDDDEPTTPAATEEAGAAKSDLEPVKAFLLDHTEQLKAETAKLREGAEAYYALAEAVDFDYAKLLQDKRTEVAAFVEQAQEDFAAANPAYEQMEGVVAGVPSLADFDVIIDAGSDGSDPENAAPINLKTPAGKTYDQPGNFNYLIETSAFGTEPKFAAKGVEPDLDGDGKVDVRRGAAGRRLLRHRRARVREDRGRARHRRARRGRRPTQDAFTALVVMTPTMSEYFDAWKNSRFVAGEQGRREGVRRRLAPAGHRRHPRRPADGLRRRRAADRRRSTTPRRRRPSRTSRS